MGAGLAALGGLSLLRDPEPLAKPVKSASFTSGIPDKVGGWTSRPSQQVVLPPQDESNKLYENLETRIYEGPGMTPIMLLIAFSAIQQNDIQVHRPEVCYPASGFPIKWSKPTEISYGAKRIEARELLADRGGLTERILYWVRVGDTFPTSWAEQRLSMALQNLRGRIPDGALVRVSAIENEESPSSDAIMNFIAAFLDTVRAPFRDGVLL